MDQKYIAEYGGRGALLAWDDFIDTAAKISAAGDGKD